MYDRFNLDNMETNVIAFSIFESSKACINVKNKTGKCSLYDSCIDYFR